MGVCPQGDVAHSLDQFAERRSTRQIGAHDKSVHEESNKFLDLCPGAVCYGRPDNDIFLTGISEKESLIGSKQRHEQRGAFGRADCFKPSKKFNRQNYFFSCATISLNCRTHPIRRKLQYSRRALQLPCPVVKVLVQHLVAHPLPLPHPIVGILDGQFREWRLLSFHKSRIKKSEFAHELPHGPAVTDDVVHVQQ